MKIIAELFNYVIKRKYNANVNLQKKELIIWKYLKNKYNGL